MADDIAVTLLLTRDGIDVTSEVVGGRILNAPAGDYVATWTASDGVLPSIIKTESLTVEGLPVAQVPTITGSIADRTYTVGQLIPATDLRTKFAGATSYVVTPTTPWVFINGYNLVFDAGSALEETSFSVRGVNADGQSDPVTFNLTISIAQQAPSVQTPPTITGGTTAADSWTLNIGSATGIPTPGSTHLWRVNDEVQDGQSGGTFSKPGLVEGDQIRGGVRWSNSQGEVTVWTDPITITVQPALTATPPALTAGQQAGITFNTTPDSVTISQGGTTLAVSGTGTSRTFTPLTTDPVSISATKAGWSPYSAVIENVQPAPAALSVDPAYNVWRVDGLTATPSSLAVTAPEQYAGTESLSSATAADGPEPLDTIALEVVGGGSAVPGKVLRLDLKKWATESPGTFKVDALEFRAGYVDETTLGTLLNGVGREYTAQEADRGTTIRGRYVLSDSKGQTVGVTAGVAIPANTQPDAPTVARTDIAGQTFQSGEAWTKLSGTGTVRVWDSGSGFRFAPNGTAHYYRGAANRGANQYAKATWWKGAAPNGVSLAVQMQVNGANTNRHVLWSDNNQLLFRTIIDGVTTTHATISTASMPSPCVLELELIEGTTLRAYANGAQIAEKALSGGLLLTGGGIGLFSFGADNNNTMTNFEARATR